MSEDYELRIEGPLPLDIAANLMSALGSVYPNATTVASTRPFADPCVTFRISAEDRVNPQGAKASDTVGLSDAQDGMDLLALSAEGSAWSMPEWIGRLVIPMFKTTIEMFPDAENYLEQQFRFEGERDAWVAYILRPGGMTPHELRRAAEARCAELERQIAALTSDEPTR